MGKISLLDCTLRDGAYITDGRFGAPAMSGIIKKMKEAKIDIVECGWLKNKPYEKDTTFYHMPADAAPYLGEKTSGTTFVAMIDWDRYDVDSCPSPDGQALGAIRVVFPHGKHAEGIAVGEKLMSKGYKVFFQAANTMAYSDRELLDLAEAVNEARPVALSVVDTFGAMYDEDLERIVGILHRNLDESVALGFHSHNNRQLSFALTMKFVKLLRDSEREAIVDASLCGMGRGAGNATTELVASFLNEKCHGHYDMDAIMDAIDTYMQGFQERFTWGYSTPYFIAGLYQCHVNNIAYLLSNHRTNAKDMRQIIASLTQEQRRRYDYDLLEGKYMENQDRHVEDEKVMLDLRGRLAGRTLLLVAPGKSSITEQGRIKELITAETPVVVAVNAILDGYDYDFLFFTNSTRYEYAKGAYGDIFATTEKVLLSNIKTQPDFGEHIVGFNRAIKRGWPHFDNAVICCLRLMDKLDVQNVKLAGFDGFKTKYNESYADASLPTLNPGNDWDGLNREIMEIFTDLRKALKGRMKIDFVTESIFDLEE